MSSYSPQICWTLSILILFTSFIASCGKTRKETTAESGQVELSIVDSTSGEYVAMQGKMEGDFTRETGIKIKSIVGNETTDSLLSEQLEWLRSGARVPDICYLDNVWAGSLDQYLLDLTPYVSAEQRAEIIPGVLQAYTVGGRLIALPRETNFPLLYYRSDLLNKYGFHHPPKTWDELERMASTIQNGERKEGNKNFWGYAWEGTATESLTCVGQEYQVSSGGGHMLEPDGSVSVNNVRAAKAFARAAGWINRISPPGTPAYAEEDVRNVWEIGNAAFARNWTEGYSIGQTEDSRVRGKFGITVLPHDPGQASASTVGGWGYGVSKYSLHPREAARFVLFLTSRAAQAWRLQHFSELPSITSLYSDRSLRASTTFLQPVQMALFQSAVARPSGLAGSHYEEASAAYAKAIHSVLVHQRSAPEAVAALEQELSKIIHSNTEATKPAPAL